MITSESDILAAVKESRLQPATVMISVFAIVFVLSRIPNMLPQNFSAAYALAFCCGVYLRGRLGWFFPLGLMLGTDFLLNVFYYHSPFLSGYMILKTVTYVALIGLGRCFRPRMAWWKLVGGGLAGALLFYIVTNTAAWLYDPGYPKTLGGLWQALTTGLPGYPPTWTFFRNTLLSGGLFTALFAGSAKLVEAAESETEKKSATEDEDPEESDAPEGAKA